MTAYEKIAISLPSQAAENARRAVREGRAPSVSAYIAAAIEAKSQSEDLESLLAALLAETGGPMTAAERREADRKLGIAKRKPGRRRR